MRFMLVDASHLAHRCRHAQVGQLSTSGGVPSGVVYGFLRGFDYAVRQTNVDFRHVVVIWDGGHAAKRKELLPSYKESRRVIDPTPEEITERKAFYWQMEAIQKGLSLLGIRSVRVQGTEADDLISLIAAACVDRGDDAVIFSGDKDVQQLVSDKVAIWHPQHEMMTEERVLAKWGITSPFEIVRLLSLIGDKSDDIVGVKGVGEKRAPLVLPFWDRIWDEGPCPENVSEAVWRWVLVCRQHREIIERNVELITLPKTWDASFYGVDVAITVASQLKDAAPRDIAAFLSWCRQWELQDLHLSHW
jgi:DNA polymerase I